MNYSPDTGHDRELYGKKPLLSFDKNCNYTERKALIREKLVELIGEMPEKVPLNIKVIETSKTDLYSGVKFTFDAEKDVTAVAWFLTPNNGLDKYPVVICLQGHSTGMHISLGIPVYEGDENMISCGDRDFALQTVRQGYAALVLEQRAFGERKSDRINGATTCQMPAMAALMLGRTLMGERVWDISRAIDALYEFPKADISHIACMGNSGGGTATFYAACLEPRINLAMPSCSVCTYKSSICAMRHCTCNYIPSAAKFFDMGDLACLIAPRPLIIVAGEQDNIFPKSGVLEAFETIKYIYEKEGSPQNCRLVMGPEGHRFYADLSWPVFGELFR